MSRYSDRTRQICAAYKAGWTIDMLAGRFALQRATIRELLVRHSLIARQARTNRVTPIDLQALPPVVNRDPCFRYGTRADLGCTHQVQS